MSIKYYCDGCDDPIEAGRSFIVKCVTPAQEMEFMKHNECRTVPGDCFDLCPKCEERLRASVNPKEWPREGRQP